MATEPDRPSDVAEPTPLRAIVEVAPPEGVHCPVADETPNAAAVTQTITERADDRTCQSEVTVADETGPRTELLSTPIGASCVCSTIKQFECVYDIQSVREGALRISIVVFDRTLLEEITAALEEIGAEFDLKRLSTPGDESQSTVEVDAAEITEKQREALELAVDRGYYERPREATLQDLADRLGVSPSAVSQRLNAAESTLVRSLTRERSEGG